MASTLPTVTIVQSRPAVGAAARIAPTMSESRTSTALVAPNRPASSRRSGEGSRARISLAPRMRAPWMALTPTPPAPITAPRLPAGTSIVAIAAPMPVITAQPTSAATSAGRSSGIGIRLRAATTACSAKQESSE